MKAAPPEMAERLYLDLVEDFKGKGLIVSTGQFQAHMQVALVNDGPVTILLESSKEF
jgi:D-tyrosyl-tRNA(Tyr) deacylase